MLPTINTETRLCAVIGDPVAHSLSPAMHNAAFAAAGLNYVYVAFHVRDVAAALAGMRALGGFRGMSITIPHKLAALHHVDRLDPMAARIGAINTVTNDDGVLTGSNTDGLGVLRSFADAGIPLVGRRVLFLGTGGAVRSAAFAVAEQSGAAHVSILGRTAKNVDELVRDLQAGGSAHVSGGDLAADLEAAMAAHDIVIQGTPLGMAPQRTEETPVPAALFRAEQVVFDMVYTPRDTRLLREAAAAGCTTILGLEMLVNQAVVQWEGWTGQPAPRTVMRDALVAALEKRA